MSYILKSDTKAIYEEKTLYILPSHCYLDWIRLGDIRLMCIKNMRSIFVIIILLVFSGLGFCFAEPIKTEILQIKMNRIYFASGEEENIFQDCSFFVIKSDDTLIKGYIEKSYAGVSYSYPTEKLSDTITTDSCSAFIQPATIDSLTPVIIGIHKLIPYGSSSNFPGLLSVTVSDDSLNNGLSKYGNILHTYLYESETEMLLDFESGLIDAFISYKQELPSHKNQKYSEIIHAPAPFYAALIPNISKAVNNKGLLTTSLYYRFNDERLSSIFYGDNTVSYNCLFPAENSCRRLYAFDPDNGRNLLNYIDKIPKKLFMSIDNNSLEKLGLYFADILSRDKIRLKFAEDNSKADIYLKFIPLSEDNNDSSLTYILKLLKADSPANKKINSTISEIEKYIESANNANAKESQQYYLNLAQRALTEDLGVFPLLRPSLYFSSGNNLKGCAFDNNGHLDLSNLRKVLLPSRPAGANR